MDSPKLKRGLVAGFLLVSGGWRLAHSASLAWHVPVPSAEWQAPIFWSSRVVGVLEIVLALVVLSRRGALLVWSQILLCAVAAALLGAPDVMSLAFGCRLCGHELGSWVPAAVAVGLAFLTAPQRRAPHA